MILAVYGIQDVNDEFAEYIHDHNFAIADKNELLQYVHLERITGEKYDNTLHKHLYKLLKQEQLLDKDYTLGFIDSVVGRSFVSSEGKIRFEVNPFAKLNGKCDEGLAYWLDRHKKAYGIRHELAHIFSLVPFYGLFRENSLLVHFDGGASVSNVSVWLWRKSELELLHYGFDLKFLSSLFNANALNFFILGIKRKQHLSFPGKFMGFAGWGQYDKEIEQWLIENNFFEDIWHNKKLFFLLVFLLNIILY